MKKQVPPPPPPPPPPAASMYFLSWKMPGKPMATTSLTKQEIAKYWNRKRKIEEDHFLDAIKAAARIRARNFSEEDYKHFVDSLKDDEDIKENKLGITKNIDGGSMKEKRSVGIEDSWWMTSKYAYLNQPAVKSMELGGTYIPQLYCYKPPPPPLLITTTTFGIF